MATAMPQETICSLVRAGTLKLETKAGSKPDYNSVLVTGDMLLVTDGDSNSMNLQFYNRHDGKLLSTSQTLADIPMGVCLISKTEVAVCLLNRKILILSFESLDDVKVVKTFDVSTGIDRCDSVAKLNLSDKLVVSGVKSDNYFILNWCVVNLTDGHVDSTHEICIVGWGSSRLALKDNTIYISCITQPFTFNNGLYAYDIFYPHKQKFLYQHEKLIAPGSIIVDKKDFIYLCDRSYYNIHQLTNNGQLVTIHTVLSNPRDIFYDDHHGVVYTTGRYSNVMTLYRLEYLHQPVQSKLRPHPVWVQDSYDERATTILTPA